MDNPLFTVVISAIVGGGGSSMLFLGGKGLFRYVTGRAGRERERTRNYAKDLLEANDALDDEQAYRRIISEYASTLRGILNENGLGHLVPEWPANPNTPRSTP